MPIHSLFATPLYVVDLPETLSMHTDLVNFLKNFSSGRVSHEERIQGTSYTGANSFDKSQYIHTMKEVEPLFRIIHRHAGLFAKELQFDLEREHLYLGRSWVNILQKGGQIEIHNHVATLFSGVYYLTIPTENPILRLVDPKASIRKDPIYTGEQTPYNLRFIDVPIQPGRLILFPGWLSHGMPFPSPSERITIAFDYFSVSLNGQSPPPPPLSLVANLWKIINDKK